MNIVGIAGIAICAAIVAAMLRRYNQEYAITIVIAAGIIILIEMLSSLAPAIRQIQTLLSSAGLSSSYALILFKTLGICFLAQFAADSCRDAGENALASKVELAGKITIVILALPLFEKIAKTAVGLIGTS
jgi:stage III sporulation protein AD